MSGLARRTQEEPGLSLREIGRRCGLHHETVKRVIEDDGAVENRQPPPPDPIVRLVGQVCRTYAAGHGWTQLGFGRAGDPRAFGRAIEAHREEERSAVAEVLDAFGRAFVAAAQPYLQGR